MALLNLSACLAPVLHGSNVAVETWYDDRMPPDLYGQLQKRSFAAIALRNRVVSHDWSRAALRVMADAAQDAGVMFEDVERDDDLSLPDELLPLCHKARAQGKAVRSGLEPVLFSQNELEVIAEKYIHCSAHWNAITVDSNNVIQGGASPLQISGFINRPDEDWWRAVYNIDGNKV